MVALLYPSGIAGSNRISKRTVTRNLIMVVVKDVLNYILKL